MLTEENMRLDNLHPYHCMMRPPAPGAIPRDGLKRAECREGKTISGHHYWGTAIYDRKLTEEEIRDYELEETCFCVTD